MLRTFSKNSRLQAAYTQGPHSPSWAQAQCAGTQAMCWHTGSVLAHRQCAAHRQFAGTQALAPLMSDSLDGMAVGALNQLLLTWPNASVANEGH